MWENFFYLVQIFDSLHYFDINGFQILDKTSQKFPHGGKENIDKIKWCHSLLNTD